MAITKDTQDKLLNRIIAANNKAWTEPESTQQPEQSQEVVEKPVQYEAPAFRPVFTTKPNPPVEPKFNPMELSGNYWGGVSTPAGEIDPAMLSASLGRASQPREESLSPREVLNRSLGNVLPPLETYNRHAYGGELGSKGYNYKSVLQQDLEMKEMASQLYDMYRRADNYNDEEKAAYNDYIEKNNQYNDALEGALVRANKTAEAYMKRLKEQNT